MTDRARVQQNIEAALDKIPNFDVILTSELDTIQGRIDADVQAIEDGVKMTIVRAQAELMQYVALVVADTAHTINKAYYHASPGLLLILYGIWSVALLIWKHVQTVISIIALIKELGIDDLLASIWPAFAKARAKFRELVGELSEAIGWGADGLLHLLHASQGFVGIYSGLSGKSFEWMDVQWMVKTERVLTKIETASRSINDEPGRILEYIFQSEEYNNKVITEPFGFLLVDRITEALTKGRDAVTGLGGVVDELSQIRNGMPESVRKHIPQSIWDGLDWADNTINDVVLPRVNKALATIILIESQLDKLRSDAADIVDRITHPGELLLTVDDLPDYAREAQEAMIDDVANRTFNKAATAERDGMSSDISEFDLLYDALSADTPEPVFLGLESPERGKITGIVAEPLETWFINGFADKL